MPGLVPAGSANQKVRNRTVFSSPNGAPTPGAGAAQSQMPVQRPGANMPASQVQSGLPGLVPKAAAGQAYTQQPTQQSMQQPMQQPTQQSMQQSMQQLMQQPMQQPMQQSTQQPMQQPLQTPEQTYAQMNSQNYLSIPSKSGNTASQAASAFPSAPDDYTDRLQMKAGLVVVFPIREGIDSKRHRLGDYQFWTKIDEAGEDGFAYHWTMGPPVEAEGTRNCDPGDEKDSTQVSLFYQKNQHCTMSGYTNTLRVSDALYRQLRAGNQSNFSIDMEGQNIPSSIHPVGLETVTVYINDKPAKVRAIKAETDNGWEYWIMDNSNFPVLLQGTGPFKWMEPRFSAPGLEAGNVINQMENTGKGSTQLILFAFNSANLEESSKPILDEIANYLNGKPGVRVAVEGHCDNIGSQPYNLNLSQKRAESVREYLTTKGVTADRLEAKGYGFLQPIADNRTEQGRAQNRRVVFRILR